MACDTWRNKIAAYSDGELAPDEMRSMGAHLPSCASCTEDLLNRVQLKRAVQAAGKRYSPGADLRRRVQAGIPARNRAMWLRGWMPKLAAAAALAAIALLFLRGWPPDRQEQTFAELADIHVATLASATPVDVVSTDRHTVKPWFQGKLPFTFNLPELANSPFTLEGGRVSYLDQAPGAHLIFKIGNHRISVFIFQNQPEHRLAPSASRSKSVTFHVESWTDEGLRYFVIGDADPGDIHKLSELLRAAARP
jgi:anti-sigma factor RsiW